MKAGKQPVTKMRRPTKGSLPKVALGGEVTRESLLPLPFVQYPRHYGAFHAYSSTQGGPYYLCRCQEPALDNLINLLGASDGEASANVDYERQRIWSHLVPPAFRTAPTREQVATALPFDSGICHRCHLAPAELRWSHEMYAGQFMQYYGWFVKQAYLRFGFSTHSTVYLKDVAPPELVELKVAAEQATRAFQTEETRILEIVRGPQRSDIAPDEITYWQNVRPEEAAEMIRLRRMASRARSRFANAIESIVRTEFGQRKVGERWVAETQLYQIIRGLLPGEEIVRHERPDWLQGLEIDIVVPGRKLAIEYQGQQHFKPIDAWGGTFALRSLQERDARKRLLCGEHGLQLVEFDYTEPLTPSHVASRLRLNSGDS